MISLKNLYASFLFYFYSNRKVVFSNETATVSVVCDTYYSGDSGETLCTINKKESTKENGNTMFKNENTKSKISTVMFVENKSAISPSTSTLYIFQESGDIPYSQKAIFFDSMIPKVILEKHVFDFMLKSIEYKNISIRIKRNTTFLGTLLTCISCLMSITGVFAASRSFIIKLSKFDPTFSDFNILSSNVKKFKDLEEKNMTECTICFEEFAPDDDVRVLDCKHYYHHGCIDRWLIGHSKRCPCCRGDIEIHEKV